MYCFAFKIDEVLATKINNNEVWRVGMSVEGSSIRVVKNRGCVALLVVELPDILRC